MSIGAMTVPQFDIDVDAISGMSSLISNVGTLCDPEQFAAIHDEVTYRPAVW